MDEDPKK